MKDPYSVVLGTIFTERSTLLQEEREIVARGKTKILAPKYTFKVHRGATKIDIKRAVETIFKVSVTRVNTIRMPGKLRRVRQIPGYSPSWKKAVVTLKKGDSIDFA